jgi:hypothetical protein
MVPKPLSSLKSHPDLAKSVGLVVADYAVLDALMYAIFATLSAEEPERSIIEFYTLRSAHLREELVNAAASAMPSEVQKAISRLWRRFKGAADRRTEIAHCLFIETSDAPMRMRLHKGKIIYDRIDQNLINRTFDQFHALAIDMLTLIAFLSGTLDKGRTIVARLPLSPHYRDIMALEHSSAPPTPDELRQLAASLSRLGLSVIA